MPYIKQSEREAARREPNNPGELNYAITSILIEYVQTQGLRYQVINDVLGALEGSKLEFYARVARPYEDTKIAANGDVYPPLTPG
jgi:hypothetical protein